MKKVGLYNSFLDTLGGGEKHILSIIDVLGEQGAEITIFWDKDLTKEIKNRFSLRSIDSWKWLPNVFKHKSIGNRILRLVRCNIGLAQDDLKVTFDFFFYVTDGSYFFSSAKKNFVFCMVPDKKLYNLNFLNRFKLWNYKFISNSPYTTKWLSQWKINPITIPPYIDDKLFNKNKKEKVILSVGRFFSHLHSKNQKKIIKTFKLLRLSNPVFKDYKLILAGGLKNEDRSYFNQLKSFAKDSSILFKPNVSLDELYKLYRLSAYFWHFTGLGVVENNHPEQVEHFGIAPLEAIASGCLTFCHNSGGPKEIIKDGKTGFLFDNEKQLMKKMILAEKDQMLRQRLTEQGKNMVKKDYNYEVFKKRVLKIL